MSYECPHTTCLFFLDGTCTDDDTICLQMGSAQCLLGRLFNAENTVLDLRAKLSESMEIIKAVAHTGIDFGYGEFELNDEHVAKARKLYEDYENER